MSDFILPQTPLQAMMQLHPEVRGWWQTRISFAQMKAGLAPNPASYWQSLSESDQWKVIAELLEETVTVDLNKPPSLKRIKEPRLINGSSGKDSINSSSGNLKLFDLNNLILEDKRSLHPHVAWFCPSGWGKDFNSSKLIAKADGEIIACLIKEPEIWHKHCPQARIICNGYDVREIEKVLQEVCDRNESRMLNHEPKTPLTVVFSDYPSITDGIKDITDKYIGKILRDARSNLIRFWFLIQEGNVAALKLEGRSDLLRNITLVRGGDFALEHGLSLVKTGLLTKQDIQFLNDCDRPCIVGNTPAQI